MSESVSSTHSNVGNPLGQATGYPEQYDSGLLFPLARAETRSQLNLSPTLTANHESGESEKSALPFQGADLWNAYELSWLGPGGKPEIRAAQFRVPCESPSIIESKSLKLYLNSLNQHRFASPEEARETIESDLTDAAGAPVAVYFYTLPELDAAGFPVPPADAQCLDSRHVSVTRYSRAPDLLRTAGASARENTSPRISLYTNLFKSNCPVTGQPDWASVFIEYAGNAIDEEGLLAYLISFRNEQDFHEHCVEQIFVDISERCRPEKLTVYACFLRRGGIDINPFRSNFQEAPQFLRSPRQ